MTSRLSVPARRRMGLARLAPLVEAFSMRPRTDGVRKYPSIEAADASAEADLERRDATERASGRLLVVLALWLVGLVVSGLAPHDRLTWWMEVAPVLLLAPVLVATARRFPLTPLLLGLVFVHGLILMLGAHYTYARVPPGDWVKEWFDLSRNHYDRLGHFAQGFVPAIAVREVLLRTSPLRPGRWLFFLVTATCLGFSAFYEFIEWWAAVFTEEGAVAFLGTQGDAWDTQWDMFLCLVGALIALTTLPRVHDRQLAALRA